MIREKPRENVVADRLTRFTPWLPDGSSSERCTGCGRRVYASEMALSLDGAVFHSRCALYESQTPAAERLGGEGAGDARHMAKLAGFGRKPAP